LHIVIVVEPPTLAELMRRYARDDHRLAWAARYERVKDGVREQVWKLETGDVLKVSRETHGEKADTLEEISLSDIGYAYFVFRKVTERQPDGGTRVTEERTSISDLTMIQKTRRTATFPPGAAAEIPANAPSEKLDISGITDVERVGATFNQAVEKITGEVCVPEFLAHDPAKGAPPEWARMKTVRGTLSPDGRYALAWAPMKKDFDWADYATTEWPGDFWTEPGGEEVVNFIADLKTHTVAGKTEGIHFGTRQRYNHREVVMAWSPDSRTFVELNTEKWNYAACCIGHLTDGKLDTMLELGKAVEKRADEFLRASKNRGYRRHAKEMEVAIYEPVLKNDGTGSIDVTFQVMKSPEDDAVVSVRVRFRLHPEKHPQQIEMLGAALAPRD
jgi:hypothetical protein